MNDSLPDFETTRLPPQAIEAEQWLLGGLLLDNQAWDRVCDIVRETDFYRGSHRKIFRAITQLLDCAMPADVLTVADVLGADLQECGGLEYVGGLSVNTQSPANIRQYAEIVRDRAIRRELITVCNEAMAKLYAPNPQPGLIEEVQEQLFRITNRNRETRSRPFPQILSEVVESIDRRHNTEGGDITGLPTGFIDLDKMTAGFQPGDLIVVAGRPSMGKSAIAMNIVEHVCVELGKSCAVFSLEMADTQLVQRMLGSVGRVNQHQLRTGRLDDDDWRRISDTHRKLGQARVVIEETFDLQPATLRAKARRMRRENPDLALIVVDYLQLMDGEAEKRVDAVAEITRGLKRIAKELSIPVLALSQLNRAVEARTNKRPMMADLRESGAIEQDADLILFMYREEVYDPETPNPGLCEVIIGKQRNGPTGVVNLTFLAQYARFENWAGEIRRKEYKSRSRPFETRQRADIDG
jgi:replicative DNA helicase